MPFDDIFTDRIGDCSSGYFIIAVISISVAIKGSVTENKASKTCLSSAKFILGIKKIGLRTNELRLKCKYKNKGAQVLSARLVKLPNLLTKTLTRCFCNARGHVSNFGGDWAENNHEITAKFRANNPNFKQN